jgi:hypothetical protein
MAIIHTYTDIAAVDQRLFYMVSLTVSRILKILIFILKHVTAFKAHQVCWVRHWNTMGKATLEDEGRLGAFYMRSYVTTPA